MSLFALVGMFMCGFGLGRMLQKIRVVESQTGWSEQHWSWLREAWKHEYRALSLEGQLKKACHDRDRYKRRLEAVDHPPATEAGKDRG